MREILMAEECTDSSVGTSPTPPSWWPDLHGNSLSSWNNLWHNQNPNSNSSCEEDVSISTSFTNASNHSGFTVESSRRLVDSTSSNELLVEHASENNIWSHVLLSIGTNGELQNNHDSEGNFVDDALSSKSLSTGMLEPACDYLRKLDNSWEFTDHSTSFNNFDKYINGFSDTVLCNERLTKLSDLVSSWSSAPPDADHVKRRFDPQACNISLSPSMDCYSHSDQPCDDHMKQTFVVSTSSCLRTSAINSGLFPCSYGHDMKLLENEHHDQSETPPTFLRRSFNNNEVGYPTDLDNSFLVDKTRYYKGMAVNSSTGNRIRSFADVISFSNRIGKPLLDIHSPNKHSCFKKQGLQTSSLQLTESTCSMKRVNIGKGQNTSEGKRKKSEYGSGSGLKKSKHECATASSVKTPKVKIGERITTLQQIVSPFGKTDTASVLFEAIQYIKFLQEQVQLLSNPYMKTNLHKDPCGGFDRKENGDTKLDLRSRGLCLVPTSSTPQIYRENTGSDYWSTPTYRGCLYG